MSDGLDWSGFAGQQQGRERDITIPRFHIQAIKNEFQSTQKGREIFEDQEFVEIITPGLTKSRPCRPVTDADKARWPKQYEAFKKGLEPALEGTPLENWPRVGVSQVRMLKSLEIHTLEQLAAVGDDALQHMGMGARDLRREAQVTLETAAKGTAPIARLVAENAQQGQDIEMLKRQLADQAAIIEELRAGQAAKPRKKEKADA